MRSLAVGLAFVLILPGTVRAEATKQAPSEGQARTATREDARQGSCPSWLSEEECLSAGFRPRGGPCSIKWNYRPHPAHKEEIKEAVRDLIRCAVRRWPVPLGVRKALEVAECESGFWPWALGGGVNLGVYQHQDIYWAGRARKYLRPEWFGGVAVPSAFNARANVIVSIRMARTGGWGPWSCAG